MDKKLIWIGGGIVLLLGLVAAATALFSQPPSFRGTSYGTPYPIAAEIDLTKADGGDFRLSDQLGKIVLLYFGYTSCPDICPTTLAEMKQVMMGLGDGASAFVQFVMVSVDPDRDTPEKIQAYVESFHPDFLGLTGTLETLEPIWRNYSITREAVQSESAFGVIINHTARLFLVDQEGNMRLSYAYQTPVQDIIHDITLLLEQEQ